MPLPGGALVNTGGRFAEELVFVSANAALSAAMLAVTVNGPAVAFAVNAGATATPEASLDTRASVPAVPNVPEGPVAGAVNVIGTPAIGRDPASRTSTFNGVR
jgi:hypothetical protein